MPSWLCLGFQDMSSPSMGELSFLHDHVMTIMLMVIILISYVMFLMLFSSSYYKFLSEGTLVETIWSLVPAFLLVILVFPSMKVLYMVEDIKVPSFTFKVVAHQWYWSYVSPLLGLNGFSGDSYFFDSVYMADKDFPRAMVSSLSLVVPVNSVSRFLITSTDVIHSFAVPSIGLKVDALPGRINQIFANPIRVGKFFGQCSEICGSNHSFMPISLLVVGMKDYDFSSYGLMKILSSDGLI